LAVQVRYANSEVSPDTSACLLEGLLIPERKDRCLAMSSLAGREKTRVGRLNCENRSREGFERPGFDAQAIIRLTVGCPCSKVNPAAAAWESLRPPHTLDP